MKVDSLDNYRKDDFPVEKSIMNSVNFFKAKVLVVGKPAFLEKILSRTKEVTATENFEWKFREKHYDVVLVYLTFREKSYDKVIWKMYNSLKAKGKIVILNFSENPFVRLGKRIGLDIRMPTENELKGKLFEVGFRITHIEKLRQFYKFASVGEAMLAIKTNGIFGNHVPADRLEKVKKFFGRKKGTLRFPAENHLIIAEKMSFE